MRKHSLVDLNARFVRWDGRVPGLEFGPADAIKFECPEGHRWGHNPEAPDGYPCEHTVPFTPAMDETPRTSPQHNGAHWERHGNTIETLVLSPSIRCSGLCTFHGFVGGSGGQTPGEIEFCGDSG